MAGGFFPVHRPYISGDTDTSGRTPEGWLLDHSYARLPDVLFHRQAPVLVKAPHLVVFNKPLAADLGLDPDGLDGEAGANYFSGNRLPPGALPIAQAYAGHQFGGFTMLGDGRAILLGEQITPDGRRVDIQLKGAGQTPFSRRGDGRAALGPMLREYLVSEAMQALGIPTTRSLAVVTTGEPVIRESVLAGAILTRVAASHIRVGTFEYLAARRDTASLRILTEYTIQRHYPGLTTEESSRIPAFLEAVCDRQMELVVRWMLVGFVHGVMNTDNVALSGETIDYGPCAFMDHYDPGTVFSSIDTGGRYAYGRQASITHWNLTRLAEALIPLLHADEKEAVRMAEEILGTLPGKFQTLWSNGLRAKLGLTTREDGDEELIGQFLALMQEHGADWTLAFRSLAEKGLPGVPAYLLPAWQAWQTRWTDRLERQPESTETLRQGMRLRNPAVIPRNHLVERVLDAATNGDTAPFLSLLDAVGRPFEPLPEDSVWMAAPEEPDPHYRTFCGT